MRKLVSGVLMTVNGVIGSPHEWAVEFDEQAPQESLEQLRRSHAMLMGRRTYEILSALWPGRAGEYPEAIDAIRTYVFSSTLEEVSWTGRDDREGRCSSTASSTSCTCRSSRASSGAGR